MKDGVTGILLIAIYICVPVTAQSCPAPALRWAKPVGSVYLQALPQEGECTVGTAPDL